VASALEILREQEERRGTMKALKGLRARQQPEPTVTRGDLGPPAPGESAITPRLPMPAERERLTSGQLSEFLGGQGLGVGPGTAAEAAVGGRQREEEETQQQEQTQREQEALQQEAKTKLDNSVKQQAALENMATMFSEMPGPINKQYSNFLKTMSTVVPTDEKIAAKVPEMLADGYKMMQKWRDKQYEAEQALIRTRAGGSAQRDVARIGAAVGKKKALKEADVEMGWQRSVALARNTWIQFKNARKEMGLLGEFGGLPGRLAERGLAKAQIGDRQAIDAYQGQKSEHALSISGVLTGQNRMIESIVRMIRGTIPDVSDAPAYAAKKLSQSLRNGYRLTIAISRAGLWDEIEGATQEDKDDINSEINQKVQGLSAATLTPEEEGEIDNIIRSVLDFVPSVDQPETFAPTGWGRKKEEAGGERDFGAEYDF